METTVQQDSRARDTIHDFNASVGAVQSQIAAAEGNLALGNAAVAHWQAEKKRRTAECHSLADRVKALEAECARLRRHNEAKRAELSTNVSALATMQRPRRDVEEHSATTAADADGARTHFVAASLEAVPRLMALIGERHPGALQRKLDARRHEAEHFRARVSALQQKASAFASRADVTPQFSHAQKSGGDDDVAAAAQLRAAVADATQRAADAKLDARAAVERAASLRDADNAKLRALLVAVEDSDAACDAARRKYSAVADPMSRMVCRDCHCPLLPSEDECGHESFSQPS